MESQQPLPGLNGPDEVKHQENENTVEMLRDSANGLDLDMDDVSLMHVASQPSLPDQLAHLELSVPGSMAPPFRVAASSTNSSRRPSLAPHQVAAIHAHVLDVPQEFYDPMEIEGGEEAFNTALDELGASVPAIDQPSLHSSLSQVNVIPIEAEQRSRPDPNVNHDMCYFFRTWRFNYYSGLVEPPIGPAAANAWMWDRPSIISQVDIDEGVAEDMQGIQWSKLATTRDAVRKFRRWYHQHSKVRPNPIPDASSRLDDSEQLFHFRQMNMEHRAWIEHYQLRNLLVTTSSSDVYYVAPSKVMHTSPSRLQSSCVMDLTDPSTSIRAGGFRVTSLASADNLLIAGGYRGEYALQNLNSEHGAHPIKGRVSYSDHFALTNHVHTFTNRTTSQSQAVFCSNDKHIRVLDCATNTFVSEVRYDDVVNCAATSPNGRLRLLVGDFAGSDIVDADSGRSLKQLGGHHDDAFACAWADDDIHVATAAQDGCVLVWDARNWNQPLADIACEMTYATSLKFSPVGGGKRVLVAAEAADVVNVIDALTWDRKQVLDSVGDIAGTSFSADGSELLVANGDRKFGGLISYERTGDFDHDNTDVTAMSGINSPMSRRRDDASQWIPEYDLDFHPRVRLSTKARSRRGLGLGDFF